MEFNTIEQFQEELLQRDSELQTMTAERDSLLQENETLKASLEEARTLNQKLFLEVRQNKVEPDKENTEPVVPSCRDLGKSLKF